MESEVSLSSLLLSSPTDPSGVEEERKRAITDTWLPTAHDKICNTREKEEGREDVSFEARKGREGGISFSSFKAHLLDLPGWCLDCRNEDRNRSAWSTRKM